jgi:hypothetical protein
MLESFTKQKMYSLEEVDDAASSSILVQSMPHRSIETLHYGPLLFHSCFTS